jgi:translation initiation factor IF-3
LSRPFPSRSSSSQHSGTRVNGKIRAREVRVIGPEGQQLGVFSLVDAINMARARGVDLVEVAATANPPVCRIIDFGKYRYEQNQKDKESKKHQHANKVKEIQLSPGIDPHDFGVKLAHAIDFLCKDMKVKVVLKFRGREMAHKEIGFQQIERFTLALAPYGHPDNQAKLVGRGVTVMFSPHPRTKRAKNPRGEHSSQHGQPNNQPNSTHAAPPQPKPNHATPAAGPSEPDKSGGFANNPFSGLDIKPPE